MEGGIRAQSRRGAIAQTWWSERFIAVLEDFGMGNRLQRGKNYARRGQVLAMEIEPGAVSARVQGSRARPYRVRVGIAAFGKADWARIERRLADDAWFAAALLAGEMPPEIEQVFADERLSLFPQSPRDLTLDCTCPDWEVPCKHLAAVFYLLAERFDRDPFEILAWRGRGREDLLDDLRAARSGGVPAADAAESAGVPLSDVLDTFFQAQGPTPDPPAPPAAGDNALDQAPVLALEVRGRALVDLLRPVYRSQ